MAQMMLVQEVERFETNLPQLIKKSAMTKVVEQARVIIANRDPSMFDKVDPKGNF